MRKVESKKIKLPEFGNPEGNELTDRDLLSLYYAQRVAIPLLGDAIKPFEDALKDMARAEAEKEVGFINDLIRGTFSRTYDIGDFKYAINIHRHSGTPGYKPVLDELVIILGNVRADNLEGIRRDCVVKAEEEAYIAVFYLLSEIERLQKPSNPTTKTNLEHLDKQGSRIVLDDKIEELRVYFNPNRYKTLNKANANDIYRAQSLQAKIKGFIGQAEARALAQYVSADGQITGEEFTFEFEDGSSARILPFFKGSISYGPVFNGLAGKKKTKDLAASCGDLIIMDELGFEAQYEKSGKGAVTVSTELKGAGRRVMTIVRGTEQRQYFALDRKGKIYVRVGDVLDYIRFLTTANTTTKPDVKIDFFPATPQYLR